MADAKLCAKNLQVALKIIEIEEIFTFGLHEYLERIQDRLDETGKFIYHSFFGA